MNVKIETPRLRLGPFEERQLTDRYVGWLNDERVVRFSELRHRRHTLESCRAYWRSLQGTPNHFWAIELKPAGDLHIGNITAIVDPHNAVADISILIGDPQAWRKGYGGEAWNAAVDWLLGEGGMRKVRAGTMAVNDAMRTLMRKAGMAEDGAWRRHYVLDGREVDVVFGARFRNVA